MKNLNSTILVLLIAFMLLSGILGYGWYQQSLRTDDANMTISALSDELKKSYNDLGQERAEKKAIAVNHSKTLTELEGLKGAQKELQDLVKQTRAEVALVAHTTTRLAETVPTVINNYDTVVTDSGTIVYPEYIGVFENAWANIRSVSNKDTTTYDISIKDKFKVTYHKKGFLKKDLYVSIFNENPYTRTNELEGFIQKTPQRRISIGPFVGVALTNDLKINATVGIGVMYDLFSF